MRTNNFTVSFIVLYLAPHGGLAPDGPFEFILCGESPFNKILDFTRLVGEFTLLDPDTNNPSEKAVRVSFVNNLGHSWIQQVELYLNDKQIIDLSTPSYTHKAFIENFMSYSKVKKEVDLRNQLYLDDDDAICDKFTLAERENLRNRRKVLHGVKKTRDVFVYH